MQEIFKHFPEILFIDGTYKLLQIDLTVVIILVEDGNEFSEVVGVGLLSVEDADNYTWLLKTFRENNTEGCENVKVIMSDKDSKERAAFSNVFPGVPLHICRFHTMQIFRRQFSGAQLSSEHTQSILNLIQKLIYSFSEEEYKEVYEKLCTVAPKKFIDYFNTHWHSIRREWTDWGMIYKNLGNLTNNRLESLNAKLKSIIQKMNSLVDFLIKFFKWVDSHNYEVMYKLSQTFLTKQNHLNGGNFEILIALCRYEDYLSSFAYNLVKENMDKLGALTFQNIDKTNEICYFRFYKSVYHVNLTSVNAFSGKGMNYLVIIYLMQEKRLVKIFLMCQFVIKGGAKATSFRAENLY